MVHQASVPLFTARQCHSSFHLRSNYGADRHRQGQRRATKAMELTHASWLGGDGHVCFTHPIGLTTSSVRLVHLADLFPSLAHLMWCIPARCNSLLATCTPFFFIALVSFEETFRHVYISLNLGSFFYFVCLFHDFHFRISSAIFPRPPRPWLLPLFILLW